MTTCPICNGKGFISKSLEHSIFYSRCTKCNGKGVLSGFSRWKKIQKYLTPEMLADFFRSVCAGAGCCEYCALWRECSKMNLDHPPLKEDWVEWLNGPEEE